MTSHPPQPGRSDLPAALADLKHHSFLDYPNHHAGLTTPIPPTGAVGLSLELYESRHAVWLCI